jgi:hypothetical protein
MVELTIGLYDKGMVTQGRCMALQIIHALLYEIIHMIHGHLGQFNGLIACGIYQGSLIQG